MGKIADAVRGAGLAQQKLAQMLSLDQEFVTLEKKVQVLETENLTLRAEVNPLKAEVERLKNQIQQEAAPSHDALDDVAEAILVAIANSDGRMPKRATARHFNLSLGQGDYYFDLLRERRFIIQSTAMADPGFSATPEGRKYLMKKGKL